MPRRTAAPCAFVIGLFMFIAACTKDAPPSGSSAGSGSGSNAGVTGSIAIDGAVATPTACLPGYGAAGTYIQIETTRGAIRFEDKQLSVAGAPVACKKLDRSWGGGHRANGTAYWRGMLDVDCDRIVAHVDVDCGNITTEERAQLDANRSEMRATQGKP